MHTLTDQRTEEVEAYPKIKPNFDRIPDALKSEKWAVWKAEPRAGQSGKFNKAPRNPLTGGKIGANKPELFGTYSEAKAAYDRDGYSGVGILLTGDGLTGVDIDGYADVFTHTPKVKAWVALAQEKGAYCERSPSGEGLRLFIKGKLPQGGRHNGSLEIYNNARFLTVTGNVPRNKGGAAQNVGFIEGQALIDSFLELLPTQEVLPAKPTAGRLQTSSTASDIEALTQWAAEKSAALWAGDWAQSVTDLGATGYASQSEADMALCGQLAREAVRRGIATDCLQGLTMRVFEKSGLYREEKRRSVENFTIPKAVAASLESEVARVPIAQESNGGIPPSVASEVATGTPGDIMAGMVFAKAKSSKLKYIPQADEWLQWDGTRWVWCHVGEEIQAAKAVANAILDHATELYKKDADRHKRRHAFATSLQNLKRLEAMVKLAKSEPGMSIGHVSALDSDAWLLGARNGVIDLRSGALLAPDPAMLITRQVAAEYHRDAQCPRWLKFLNEIFIGDTETIAFIQRALGYTLTATTTEEVLFICFGHGANGKSVFGNIVSLIMGDYAQAAPASLISARRSNDSSPRNDIARLCGARLTSINETQSGDRLDDQVVKMLAGREMISARFLNKEFFDFWPTAKPWLRTNHRPIVIGEDDGIWRRLLLIPFARKFSESERNPWLEQHLMEERDGILAWMVEGCLDWQRCKGLQPSETVRRESAGYRTESDLLGEFLDDKTERDANERIEQGDLYGSWRCWCDMGGVKYGSKANFTRKLTERGIGQSKSTDRRFYTGIKRRAQFT